MCTYSQIWVQNSFLLELSNLVQSFYYDESENSRRDDQHENSSADPEEESNERDSHLNTLNNYLTWRAIQPFISYLGKGTFHFSIPFSQFRSNKDQLLPPPRFRASRAVLREDDARDRGDGGPLADVRAGHQRRHGLRNRARLRQQSLLASFAGHCPRNVRRDQASLFRYLSAH